MKVNRILLAALVVLGGWALGTADAGQGMPWERLAQALELSEDQVHQLQTAEEAMRLEIRRVETAVQAGELGREDVRAQVLAARQILEVAWQETLSEEQKARWRQLRHDAPQSDRATDVAPLWRRIARVVDLAADQVHQLEAAEAALHKRMHRIESALHNGGLGREEAQAHIREARHVLERALQEILTDGQLARLRQAHDQERGADTAGDGAAFLISEDALLAPTAVEERSWGQIKGELAE